MESETHTFYPQYNLSLSLKALKFNNKIDVTLHNFYFMCIIPNFLMFKQVPVCSQFKNSLNFKIYPHDSYSDILG